MFFHLQTAGAQSQCSSLFDTIPRQIKGAQFLVQKNSNLHMDQAVVHTANEIKNKTDMRLTKPVDKVLAWIEYLDQSYTKYQNLPEVKDRIKNYYFNQYLTKLEEIPESYYQLQVRIAREQGQGTIQLTPESRANLGQIAMADQRQSFRVWLDYFLSVDSNMYPMWVKYWCFQGLVKLAKFDPDSGTFSNRSTGQVTPFPDLNHEALALVMDAVVNKVNGKSLTEINDPKLISLLDGANFGKLYGRALQKVTLERHELDTVDGAWIKYNRGKDHMPLVKSLEGMNTGWCTAGEETARTQLSQGDFYIYYSKDESGEAKIPRIAIRMSGNSIGEIRGVAKDQNLDQKVANSDILNNKLAEFGLEGKTYLKKNSDMLKLSQIEKKIEKNLDLSKEELQFLYEINGPIQGFGQEKDPRIIEIIQKRNLKADLIDALGPEIRDSEISIRPEEALRGGIKFYYGDLNLTGVQNAKNLRLPEKMVGRLHFPDLKNIENLVLPRSIRGDIIFDKVEEINGLALPEHIDGKMIFNSVRKMLNVHFPEKMIGELSFFSLQHADNLVLPKEFIGNISFANIKDPKGIVFPQLLDGSLSLSKAITVADVKLPTEMSGDLYLQKVSSVGLVLPQKANAIHLGIESAEGIHFSRGIKSIYFVGLKTGRGLILADQLEGNLEFSSLKNVEELRLPKRIGGDLKMFITKGLGLVLPTRIDGNLKMPRLSNVNGITFPEFLGGTAQIGEN